MNQVEVKRRQIELCSYIIGLISVLIFGKILGNNGITYLVIAWESFLFLWTISAGCLSDTLSKMLRNRMAKGQYKNVKLIRKRVLMIEGCIGGISSIILAVCADMLAQSVFKVPHCTFVILILAPTLFLRTISNILSGCLQGEGKELPVAVSAVLRQLVLMGFGVLFIKMLSDYGTKVGNLLGDPSYSAMYGAVGVAIAMVLTELFVLLFFALITLSGKNNRRGSDREGMQQTDSLINIVKIIYGVMWVPMLIKLLEALPIWIGTIFYRKSVTDMDIFAENYGLFVGKFLVICGIPALLICVMMLPVIAKTSGALKREDKRMAKLIFQSGVHIGIVHGLYLAIFVAVLANQIVEMVCGANLEAVSGLLSMGSVLILLAAFIFYFAEMLLRMGRKYHLLGVLCSADIIYILVLTILLNTEKAGVMSLIQALIVAMAVACLGLGFLCFKEVRSGIEWLRMIAIPVGASCIAGLITMLLGKVFTPHLGNAVTVFVSFLFSSAVYWVILLLLRSFRESELKMIPGGRLIKAIGQLLRVY